MKFLKDVRDDQRIAPLKFMYDDNYNQDDILSIVYKDIDTGQHFVENIEKPVIEIYITKPEYRGTEVTDKFMHDVHDISKCDKYVCRYKWRKQFAAKILNIPQEAVMTSPYVANIDVDIVNWYHLEFIREYHYDGIINIKTGYFDIETDITETSVIGECPIVCITYISETTNTVYNLSVRNEKYQKFDTYEQNVQKFIADCTESFAMYDKYTGSDKSAWEYQCVIYDNEVDMLIAFWSLVHALDDDFMVAWNAPFDVTSIVNRMISIGLNPYQIICDSRFKFKKIEIEEDTQINVVKRRHKFDLTVIPVVACLMTMYGNVNSAGPKIPTFKLNAIADKVLKDKKVEYSEFGDIMKFLYADFYLFNKYNIKDAFLMIGINHEAHVVDDTYSRTYAFGIQFPAVFSSNNMLPSVLMMEMYKMGLVVGVNRNRLNIDKNINEFVFDDEDYDEADIGDSIALANASTHMADDEKFVGAIVQDPRRMSSTGYEINGAEAQYVHLWCIDMDITSEYPTAMCLMNMSNDTFVAKILLVNDEDVKLPMYDAYELFSGEELTYTCNKAAVIAETIAQRDFVLAGKLAFNLPNAIEVDKMVMAELGIVDTEIVSA